MSMFTAVRFTLLPKFNVKSLKYVEFCIWDIKFLEFESKTVFPWFIAVKDISVFVPYISFIWKANSPTMLNIFFF